MLQKVLIANRGEIACRIMRTAEILGIETVAVYSDADAGALHVEMADEAIHIGAGPASESYLSIDKIIAAACETGADCIHPGYGFLAENPAFATACAEAKIVFVGPSPQAMRALGGKADAKRLAMDAGVPVIPGYQGDAQDLATLQASADGIGYPLMIKAISGGGGRGMRFVSDPKEFADALESAQREAQASFGDPRILIEKFIARPRHIEVQVFGDSHGNVVHMFERDCTLQRRHQKAVEEAPAPGMSAALRRDMTEAAVTLAKAVGYEGAGTVEFLVEGGRLDANVPWYFIEMNTRLQVEHPVTEEITGLDLVEWQFRVAAGERLPLEQDDIAYGGHAIEVRLCAEDPSNGFSPSTGRILEFDILEDEGVRVETGIQPGSEISTYYDSMISKIIRVGLDRDTVIENLLLDLQDVEVLGVKTNLAFLHALLSDRDVQNGKVYTGLIGDKLETFTRSEPAAAAVAEGVRALWGEGNSMHMHADIPPDNDPFDSSDAFQLGGMRTMNRHIYVDGRECHIELTWMPEHVTVMMDGADVGKIKLDLEGGDIISDGLSIPPLSVVEGGVAHVLSDMHHVTVSWPFYDIHAVNNGEQGNTVSAPINGRVAKIAVSQGDMVDMGDEIAVVEAMKMEHRLNAPCAGRIARVHVAEEAHVAQGAVIVSIETEETA